MKGAFSDVGSLFCTRLQEEMFPGTTYGYVSGGDPKHITDLTYEQLVQFHRQHYHPSNARFYSYGMYPIENHLEAIDAILSKFEKVDVNSGNMVVKPFTKPKKVKASCPPDPRKTHYYLPIVL